MDESVSFEGHIKTISSKVRKIIGLLGKLNKFLPRLSLVLIYKSFIRPQLNCANVIFKKAFNYTFHQKFESLSINAELAFKGAYRRYPYWKKLSRSERWLRKLSHLHKILKSEIVRYLLDLIPSCDIVCETRSYQNDIIPQFPFKYKFFQNPFLRQRHWMQQIVC